MIPILYTGLGIWLQFASLDPVRFVPLLSWAMWTANLHTVRRPWPFFPLFTLHTQTPQPNTLVTLTYTRTQQRISQYRSPTSS